MHSHYKAGAAVTWSLAVMLFLLGAFEQHPVSRFNLYAFAVLSALIAVTLTCLAALESVITRAFTREAAISREALATSVAEALADELEERGKTGSLHQIRR